MDLRRNAYTSRTQTRAGSLYTKLCQMARLHNEPDSFRPSEPEAPRPPTDCKCHPAGSVARTTRIPTPQKRSLIAASARASRRSDSSDGEGPRGQNKQAQQETRD